MDLELVIGIGKLDCQDIDWSRFLTLLIFFETYSPSCNSHNFASRFQCLKCHTAKPYNPAQQSNPPMYGGGGGPGGFRPGPPMKSKENKVQALSRY